LASAIAVDNQGNAYITGITTSFSFPTSPGAFQTSDEQLCMNGPCSSAFVTKLNATGTGVVYSTYLGGSTPNVDGEQGYAIAVDSQGDAYIGGVTGQADFPTTAGAFESVFNGAGEAFISKLNSAGNGLIYSTFLGSTSGVGGETIYGLALDGAGNAYVTGATNDLNFPTTPGAFETTYINSNAPASPNTVGFVSKLNPAGSALVYSTLLGGTGGDGGSAIAVDGAGDAYVGGFARSWNFPVTSGAFQTANSAYAGDEDGFVAKLNPSGTALEYSTFLGGSYTQQVQAIAVNAQGNAYVTGQTQSSDFPVTPGALQPEDNACNPNFLTCSANAFVTELNTSGSGLVFSTYLGGDMGGEGCAIALDGSDDVYVAGARPAMIFRLRPTDTSRPVSVAAGT
jgi:hypothetical protein